MPRLPDCAPLVRLAGAALLLALSPACGGEEDPLAWVDAQYTEIMVAVGTSDRDTARNVRNREARQRKAKAEEARVSFFKNSKVHAAIDQARGWPEGSAVRIKAEAYARHLLLSSPWTADEKDAETRLLGKLDEARSTEASWSTADGSVQIVLDDKWPDVTRAADALSPRERADLAAEYVESRMQVISSDLQDLVRLRNEVARRAGYDNYWTMALAAEGLEPGEVATTVAEMGALVRPLNQATLAWLQAAAKAEGCELSFANLPTLRRKSGLDAGKEEADQLFDADLAEERVMTAFQDMGIPTDGWQIHTGPQRYVRPGVYGFPIRPPQYVAIVMSQDRRWSMWQYEALAHEGGHAIWWKLLDPERASSPVLWSPGANWFEGFAQFFERMVFDPGFTARYVPDLDATKRQALTDWRRREMVTWVTDSLVQTEVERRLYEDPNNLVALTRGAAELRAELTGLPMPPPTSEGLYYDPALLSSILWTYPGYSQNFLYGYLGEAWLTSAVTAQVGEPVANAKVGPLVRDRIVRAPLGKSLAEAMEELLAGPRTDPLRDYMLGPPEIQAPTAQR